MEGEVGSRLDASGHLEIGSLGLMVVTPDFQLRLKRTLEVLHASDGHTYVLRGGAAAEFVLEDATMDERALLDAIAAGAGSLGELGAASGAPDDMVLGTVERLARLGLL